MFNSKNYVPILKWKRAEQGALKALAEDHKRHITPVIQFVMPKPKPNEQREDVIVRFEKELPDMPEKIIEVWGKDPIFIDASLLFSIPLKAKALDIISRHGHKLGGFFIPVIHLTDEEEIKNAARSAIKETKRGLCVRLICPDFSDITKLNRDIAKVLSSSGLSEKSIDILVDIQDTGENSEKYAKYFNLSQNIAGLSKWRTFTFSSGSFPVDLSGCKLDEENLIPRIDWNSWVDHIGKKPQRIPTFSDHTIRHPIYVETTQFFPPTASIKYTLENEWWIMKGKKQRFEQYLANAALLVKDKKFSGENFSNGDKYISEKAKHYEAYIKNPAIGGTGSTETWLKAGINHHLSLVAHQVSTLI
jgi:hypothetical protein